MTASGVHCWNDAGNLAIRNDAGSLMVHMLAKSLCQTEQGLNVPYRSHVQPQTADAKFPKIAKTMSNCVPNIRA